MLRKNKQVSKAPCFTRGQPIESLEPRVLLSINTSGSPSGLSPAMIEQAYDLKNIVFTTNGQTVSANGAGETIAIVDAYGDPDISSNLQTFDANFGLNNDNPSGQFVLTVATPQGSVRTDAGWATEQSLDVEWAHAIAPEANILLVEAASASFEDLTSAVVWAESQTGVVAVSMSWGSTPEFAGETEYDSDFTTPAGHAGVTFVAASGDNDVPNYPSTSPNVLAVGGTTLTVNDSGDFISESPWADSGGGVSPYEGTTTPDVAYDANPSTGFLVYDSIPYQGQSGWQVVGGTSAGSPQWAAIIALVDQGLSLRSLGSLDGPTQTISDIYALPSSDFNPVSGGGHTGLGSPVGEKIISDLVGGGITSIGSSTTSTPTATQLVFARQPGEVVAGQAISPSVTVDIEDAQGDIVTSDDSSVTISIASGPGTLGGTYTVAAVDGVATFSNLTLRTAGNYKLKTTDGSLSSATSSSFSVIAAAPSQLVFIQQPSDTTAGSTISPAITVEVEDQYGNLVSTDTSSVILTLTNGPGSLSGGGAVTAENGIATFNDVSITTSGVYSLTASDGSLAQAISSNFTVFAAAAAQLVFSEQPSNVTAGATIAPEVTVAVEDQYGNVVLSDSSSVTVAANTGPGTLNETATVQAIDGVATFNNLSLTTSGTYTLAAIDGSLSGAVSSSFAVAAAPASQLSFVQQPGNVTAGSTISPAVTVELEDQYGNVVLSDSSSVTLTLSTGPGSLSGNATVQAVNGVATFNDLSLSTAGSYTLDATDGSLASATSGSFSVTAASASQLAFVQQPTNTAAGSAISPAVTVAVEDQYGNVISSDSSSVTMSVVSGPSSKLNGTLTEQAADGIATFGDLSLNAGGYYALRASDGSLIPADSDSFAVNVGATEVSSASAVLLSFAQQPSALTAGTATPGAFVVDVENLDGSLSAGKTSRLTLSIISGPKGAAIHGKSTLTTGDGTATFNDVILDVAGDYTFQVKDGRLAVAISSSVVVEPAAPVKLLFVRQPTSTVAGSAINPAVMVELEDRFKNIATNDDADVTIAISSGPAGSTVAGTTSVAANNGVATFDDIVLNAAGRYRLTASAGGLTVVSKTITIRPAAAADASFVQEPANKSFAQQAVEVVAGHPLGAPINVLVTDAFGNPVSNGTPVTLALASAPSSGTIVGKITAVTDNGIVRFANIRFDVAGDYALTATSGSAIAESIGITVLLPVASG